MTELFFDFHGVHARLTAAGTACESVLAHLAEDLSYFRREQAPEAPPLDFELKDNAGGAVPDGPRLFRTRLFRTQMCEVRGWGRNRSCRYDNDTWVIATNKPHVRHFKIHGKNAELLYEITYMALLSAVGEALDLRGFHRVHAVGLEIDGKAGIILLPRGGGKSVIAALLQQKSGVRIYSDEAPLLRRENGGEIHPFPLRIALAPHVVSAIGLGDHFRLFNRKLFPPKNLIHIPPEKVAQPRSLSFVITGIQGQPSTAIVRAGFLRIFGALFSALVVGQGLAQMAEHMLRLNAPLLHIAFLRLGTAWTLATRAEKAVFRLGPDPQKNAECLYEFFHSVKK